MWHIEMQGHRCLWITQIRGALQFQSFGGVAGIALRVPEVRRFRMALCLGMWHPQVESEADGATEADMDEPAKLHRDLKHTAALRIQTQWRGWLVVCSALCPHALISCCIPPFPRSLAPLPCAQEYTDDCRLQERGVFDPGGF